MAEKKFRNKARFVILGILHREPQSGYDIKQVFERAITFLWDINFSQIYPELKKMKQEGLATMEIHDSENGPSRKVYTITDKGRELFQEWMVHSEDIEQMRFEILLKLFFGALGTPESLLEKVEQFSERQEWVLSYLGKLEPDFLSSLGDRPEVVYLYLPLLFGRRFAEMTTAWCEEARDLIKKYGS